MLTSRWRTLRRALRDTHGSEIAEAAMILPLFFMIFIAIFWFGQAYRIYGTLTQGARAGAESAVAPVCTTCAAGATPAANAQAAVYNALAAAHLDKNSLVPNNKWTAPNLCACGGAGPSCVATRKACDGGATDVCVQLNVQLSYPSNGGMGTCGVSVSARYQLPYHFYLPCASWPCTTLDLGNMLLPGQAQMRAETQ
jgi:Flp pilus assembly protein TadG